MYEPYVNLSLDSYLCFHTKHLESTQDFSKVMLDLTGARQTMILIGARRRKATKY